MTKRTAEAMPDLAKNNRADDRVVAFDCETFYSRNEYSLTTMTPYEYVHDPRFDCYLVSIYGPEISPTLRPDEHGLQLYVGRPELFDGWDRLRDRIIVIHNAGFDSVVIDRLVELGKIPDVISGYQCRCTADLAAYHGMRRSLANVMLVGFDRDVRTEKAAVRDIGMDGRHVEELTPEEYARLVAYAGHDAIECREVWCKFAIPDGAWYGWPEREREISTRIREACKRGFLVDVDYARQCLKALLTIRKEAEDRIPWTKWHKKRKVTNRVTHEVTYVETPEYYTALSPAGLREAVVAAKVDPPKSFAKNSPEFIDWIEHHKDLDFVFARQRYASVNVHIGAIEKLISMTDPNGIVRPNLTYFGAATGRTSSKINDESREGADNVNMLNLPRSPLLDGDETIRSVLEPWYEAKRKADPNYPPICTSGVDMRGMYMARPGHKLVVFDYSQVEARFSLWYAGDTHMMDALRTEGNLYQANAVAMKWCESKSDIKHRDPDRYRLAKCCLTADTPVLVRPLVTKGGRVELAKPRYKSIVRVLPTDRVWDGHEWVAHLGVEKMKEVQNDELVEVGGICLTGDHRVYVSDTESRRADEVFGDTEAAAISWSQSQSPVQGWAHIRVLASYLARLGAGTLSLAAREITRRLAGALRLHGVRKGGDLPVGQCEDGRRTMRGTRLMPYSTVLPRTAWRSLEALLMRCIARVSRWNRLLRSRVAIRENRGIPVYDLIEAGPRHRFWTIGIPCSNCVLGLGYGMGAAKFIDSCKAQRLTLPVLPKDQWNDPVFVSKPHFDADMRVVEEGFSAKLFDRSRFAIRSALHIGDRDMLLPENEEAVGRFLYSQKTVNEWRAANAPIVAMWGKLADDFRARVAAGKKTFSVRLPSGRIKWYWYPEIRAEETEEYDEHGVKHTGCRYCMSAIVVRDRTLRDQARFPYGVPKFFTGGHLMENVVQATCRDIMEYSAGEIVAKHPNWHFLFSCYDEIVLSVPEAEVELAMAEVPRIMCHGDSIRDWTAGMPLDVEGCADYRYAK